MTPYAGPFVRALLWHQNFSIGLRREVILTALALVLSFVCGSHLLAADSYTAFTSGLPKGSAYVIDAEKLHPTQFCLGWREVVDKTAKINRLSKKELVEFFKEKDVPIVIGPGGVPYMSDGHHTTRALLESTQAVKQAYGHVIANWSDLSDAEFWSRMQAANYANLKDEQGHPLAPHLLPKSLREMRRDPYRGLTWAVMKAGGFAEQKDVYFQEFFWADFLRDKITWNDNDDADFARAVKIASGLARQPEAAQLPGYLGPK